jgi:peptidoglycan hydrolase CwlO-like protein
MTDAIWVALVALLATPLSLIIGWLVNRKKNISDIYKNITDQSVNAASSAVETMQNAMESLSAELAHATEKIDQLTKEISELRHQNLLLLRENHSLHAKIDELVLIVNTGEMPIVAIDPLPKRPASDPAS